MKNKKLLWSFCFAISVSVLTSLAFYLGAFERLENTVYDWRVRLFRSESRASDEIAIILVDEKSLAAMNPVVGRWPWPREVYGDILSFLSMGEARAVLFDILFTENELAIDNSGGVTLSESDSVLVNATQESGNVFHAAQLVLDSVDEFNQSLLNKPLPEDFVKKFAVKDMKRSFREEIVNNVTYIPFPELYQSAGGIGIVEFSPDKDGVYRSTSLFREYQGHFFPVLSMTSLIKHLSVQSVVETRDALTLITSQEPVKLPKSRNGKYLINLYSKFNNYSISGILASWQEIFFEGKMDNLIVNPSEFKDKIVFIGASAVGVEDLKTTPMSSRMPGVELHASIVSNILERDFLTVKGDEITIFYIFVLSFAICFLVILLPSAKSKLFVPLLFFSVFIFWWVFEFKNNIVYSIMPPFSGGVASWIISFTYLSFTEGKDKRRVKKMLSQYIAPSLLNEAMKNPDDVLKASVGSKENLTILFSDIRGFTNISEKLHPEEVVDLLNQYLSVMTDIIFSYEGTLDKFIGDAIMAFWGAPVRAPDHALKAAEAAIDMSRGLNKLNEIFKEQGKQQINIGIGINTGEVILGNIGSEKKLDYTIIGDNVNLASRLEGLTKIYKSRILLSESTKEEINGKIPSRIVDMVRVKGKERPVKIFGLLSKSDDPADVIKEMRLAEELSQEAFAAYLNREWDTAIKYYNKLLEINRSDEASKRSITICNNYKETEPEESWDGVYTFTTK